MARNSAEQLADLSDALLDKRDSQQITDLIEQLERDLKETRKNAPKDR
jgi:alpha-D-ribose 1-methylphosphonate 5-triphosphate synthase subunit PhnG